MSQVFRSRFWSVLPAAAIIAGACLLTLPIAAQKSASVSGQVSLSVDGRQKFAAGARVYFLNKRAATFAYVDEAPLSTAEKATERAKAKKEAALAEWNGFWPADFYSQQLTKRIFAPHKDEATKPDDTEEYARAAAEGRVSEYQAKKKEKECGDKVEAVEMSLVATLEKAELEDRQYLIVPAITDEQGKFNLSDVTAGRFVVIARARLDSLEVYWLVEGEVKPGKSATANLSNPSFTCVKKEGPDK